MTETGPPASSPSRRCTRWVTARGCGCRAGRGGGARSGKGGGSACRSARALTVNRRMPNTTQPLPHPPWSCADLRGQGRVRPKLRLHRRVLAHHRRLLHRAVQRPRGEGGFRACAAGPVPPTRCTAPGALAHPLPCGLALRAGRVPAAVREGVPDQAQMRLTRQPAWLPACLRLPWHPHPPETTIL